MNISVYTSGSLVQMQRHDANGKVTSTRPATAEEAWMHTQMADLKNQVLALSTQNAMLSEENLDVHEQMRQLKAERDERLTLEESSRLARKVDDLEEDNAALSARLLELDAMRGAHTPERPGEFDPPLPGAADVKAALDKIAAAGRKLAGPKGADNG